MFSYLHKRKTGLPTFMIKVYEGNRTRTRNWLDLEICSVVQRNKFSFTENSAFLSGPTVCCLVTVTYQKKVDLQDLIIDQNKNVTEWAIASRLLMITT